MRGLISLKRFFRLAGVKLWLRLLTARNSERALNGHPLTAE